MKQSQNYSTNHIPDHHTINFIYNCSYHEITPSWDLIEIGQLELFISQDVFEWHKKKCVKSGISMTVIVFHVQSSILKLILIKNEWHGKFQVSHLKRTDLYIWKFFFLIWNWTINLQFHKSMSQSPIPNQHSGLIWTPPPPPDEGPTAPNTPNPLDHEPSGPLIPRTLCTDGQKKSENITFPRITYVVGNQKILHHLYFSSVALQMSEHCVINVAWHSLHFRQNIMCIACPLDAIYASRKQKHYWWSFSLRNEGRLEFTTRKCVCHWS